MWLCGCKRLFITSKLLGSSLLIQAAGTRFTIQAAFNVSGTAHCIGKNGLGKIIPINLFWHFDIFRFAARDTPKSHVGGLIHMYLMYLVSTPMPHLPKKEDILNHQRLVQPWSNVGWQETKRLEHQLDRRFTDRPSILIASSSPIGIRSGRPKTMGKDGQWTVEVRKTAGCGDVFFSQKYIR